MRQHYYADALMRSGAPVARRPVQPIPNRAVSPQPVAARVEPRPVPTLPPVAPVRSRIDMSLPGADPIEQKHAKVRRRMSTIRKRSLQTVAIAMALLIGSGSLLFMQGFFNAQKVFRGGAHAAALQEKVDPNLLKGEGEGRVNVLLLGIGGQGHDGPDLTDTMIVASIDPVNHTTSLLSVPRDLWVNVPKHGNMKINAAYAMGKYDVLHKYDASSSNHAAVQSGFDLTDRMVESVLGIDIHYNMLVNFQAFRQAVDNVGGVTVNVPNDLYDPTMAWENNWNPVLAKAGVQQFDGKQALIYVRSRETSSDFARSQRQRAVILALKQKVVELGTLSNPMKISGLMNTFGDNVVTDFNITDASRLYAITKGIISDNVKSLGLADEPNKLVTTGRVGNQSVVLPTAGMQNYSGIQEFIRRSLPDGYLVKEHAHVLVLNRSGTDGMASSKVADLTSYGYNAAVLDEANIQVEPSTRLINLSGNTNPYTKHYLERRFGAKSTTNASGITVQNGAADFILVLGSDETSSQ